MRWGQLTESRRFAWWTPYGDTEEEAVANRLRQNESSPAPAAWTPEQAEAWHKLLKTIHRRRRKPEGAPLTKTELKRKAAQERRRAKMDAWYEKHPELAAQRPSPPKIVTLFAVVARYNNTNDFIRHDMVAMPADVQVGQVFQDGDEKFTILSLHTWEGEALATVQQLTVAR